MLTIEEEYNIPQQYNYRKITKLYRVVYSDLIDSPAICNVLKTILHHFSFARRLKVIASEDEII